MDVLLECRQLQKAWGGVQALNEVDLTVSRGEIVGLAGPNGAGKSTLLNAVGGQVTLDSGRIALLGRGIERLSPVARRRLGVGRTFQAIRVFAHKTALENVELAAEYGRTKVPPLRFRRSTVEGARETLEFLGLQGKEAAIAGELGIYEQKRLMLGMAMVPQPAVLLLDEPAGGLSPREVSEMVGVIQAIRDRGTPVIVVDHVMSFLKDVVDRMLVLNEGRVLMAGSAEEVVRDRRVRDMWLGDPEERAEAAQT
jgi:branched-chain amino acid transport system ATP-binding protein